MGGVLFIDEAYYLYRPENERDYGQEAIEILLQVMEAQREDLVVDPGRLPRSDGDLLPVQPRAWARGSPTTSTSPTSSLAELIAIADLMLDREGYELTPEAREAFRAVRRAPRSASPRFANARSIRNAIDRARLRQASRLYERRDTLGRRDLMTIEAVDILASSVFADEDGDLVNGAPARAPGNVS